MSINLVPKSDFDQNEYVQWWLFLDLPVEVNLYLNLNSSYIIMKLYMDDSVLMIHSM